MNEEQATRLLRVADALRDAAAANWYFNMSSWGEKLSRFFGTDRLCRLPDNEVEFVKENRCGTPACALGHYAVRKDLQDTFTLSKSGDLYQIGPNGGRGRCLSPNSKAVQEHFGIDSDESKLLFDADGCGLADTSLEAARFIEKFIRGKGFTIS